MPWLAAIDFEVVIWGVLAVVYVLAQLLSQFTKKDGQKPGGSPWREPPREIREFLEEIREAAQAEPEEEELAEPAPAPPVRTSPPVQARPASRQETSRPVLQGSSPAYKSSVKKIDAALEQRRHLFRCQIQRQADKLNKRHHGRPVHGSSLVGEAPAELAQQNNMDYLSAGLRGFTLPSLGLPSASASLQEQDIRHSLSLNSSEQLRDALIASVVLGAPVSENPPGYKNVMTQS